MANAFKRYWSVNIGASPVTIGSYTVAAATEVTVIGLTVSNVLTSAITVSVRLNTGGNDPYLVKDAPVPAGGSLVVVGGSQKVVLETGDFVTVESSDATSCDAIMSVLEIT